MYEHEHNALGYSWGLALCLTKVRSSRARCPATALIHKAHEQELAKFHLYHFKDMLFGHALYTLSNKGQNLCFKDWPSTRWG